MVFKLPKPVRKYKLKEKEAGTLVSLPVLVFVTGKVVKSCELSISYVDDDNELYLDGRRELLIYNLRA